jgi:hypothetical protein
MGRNVESLINTSREMSELRMSNRLREAADSSRHKSEYRFQMPEQWQFL